VLLPVDDDPIVVLTDIHTDVSVARVQNHLKSEFVAGSHLVHHGINPASETDQPKQTNQLNQRDSPSSPS
jgi:hypothetical protein